MLALRQLNAVTSIWTCGKENKVARFVRTQYGTVLSRLVRSAVRGQTITYSELAVQCHMPERGNALGAALTPVLLAVARWCEERELPPLTSIVVRKSGVHQNLPGSGFWEFKGFKDLKISEMLVLTDEYHRQVFNYWQMPEMPVAK